MKKRIQYGCLIALIMAVVAQPGRAQQTATGQVIDAQSNQPIAGANIMFGDQQGTITSNDGQFHIACKARMAITVSYIGYRTIRKTIRDCSTPVQVVLIPLSYSLQNVTVEGQQAQIDIREATSIGRLGTADLNRQSGLRLREALNTLPGVEMQSRSPWGGQRITIRGYYPNAGNNINFNGMGYQLYLNNIPVTDATGTTIMDDIDFASLGRVRVIKGPSPFYGNEIAGAVNLYTQRRETGGTAISEQALGGSYGLFRSSTSLQTKNKDMDLQLNYGRQSYDGFRPHSESKKDYLSTLAHFTVSDNQRMAVYFSYNHSDEDLAGNIAREDFYSHRAISNPNYVNNDGGVKIKSFRAGITSYHNFDAHFSNKTTAFATGHTLNQNFAHGFNYYNSINVGARTNFTYQQHIGDANINGQLGAFVQRSHQSQDGVFIPPPAKPPFTPDTQPQIPTNNQTNALNYNAFTQWQVGLPLNFEVTVGGIVNFNQYGIRNMLNDEGRLYSSSRIRTNTIKPTFSPSASLLKSFGDAVSVYASVKTGHSPPLLSDIIVEDGSINEQLKPEQAVQYEIGSKGTLLDDRLNYDLAMFNLKITDRLATQYRNDIPYTTNVGEQQNKGLELALSYAIIQNPGAAISQLRVWSSYTYAHFRYKDFKIYREDNSVSADFAENTVAGIPPHKVSAGVDVQSRAGFYLHAQYKFLDKTPVTFDNITSVRSYNLLDGRLGFKRTLGAHVSVDAFVGSNDLTGSTYYNFLFVGQSEDDLGDGYISPAPYKTTVYGGATFKYRF